jgi:hypothetical protein
LIDSSSLPSNNTAGVVTAAANILHSHFSEERRSAVEGVGGLIDHENHAANPGPAAASVFA